MSAELIFVVALLAAAIVMFAINKPRMEIVALLVMLALLLSGIITLPETLAGFSDPNVILIAFMFVMGEGLARTGVSYRMGDWIVKRAGLSATRLIVLLMLGVATLGSIMSSTGVVAIFIPVVLSVAKKLRISPRMLMMPLSFAALMSGTLTLIATSPNLVVNAELINHGHAGFGFFTFTPFGLVILAVGIGYMLIARRWLRGGGDPDDDLISQRDYGDLISDYELAGRERRMRVGRRSELVGRTFTEGTAGEAGLVMALIAIQRTRQFYRVVITDVANETLMRGDILLVDVVDQPEDAGAVFGRLGLEELPLREGSLRALARQVGLAEVIIPPGSTALGKTVGELELRSRHRLDVIGFRRAGAAARRPADETVRSGDTLLVVGGWAAIRRLQLRQRDFVLLDFPAEVAEIAPAANRAPFALGSLFIMIVLMVTDFVPNVIAALIGCLLMGATRCIDVPSAYRAIQWQPLLLIVGMLPFATALERTGGVDLAAQGILSVVGGAWPPVILGALFLITTLTGLFVSNTATAVLITPLALAMASSLHASPYPFAMTVALAATSAFITPMSSPVNTLVIGPGRYTIGDFVRVGAPFNLIVMLIVMFMVPLLLPF
ncbi:SLC13 family permease [Protaetiibacter larvae]|uniref:SLC13 family permease n=1 Tax=Protaetiibacter larvae TaxID=2592654 RepID=A0A5C1Y5A4_9MICO|nr:SLC13 family permease [Protaetiibacter larvae]QEO09074.1 SLC13 family permease [Protaetiibacter larvae]